MPRSSPLFLIGRRDDPAPPDPSASEAAATARRVLREMWSRWQGASALEYTSEAVINHAGELRLAVRTHVRLRRPHFARLLFFARGQDEAARVRVCDGRLIYDRMMGRVGDTGRTIRAPYAGRLTADISHPLDEAAYSVEQFFSPTPFLPRRPPWGNAPGETVLAARLGDAPAGAPAWASKRAYKMTMSCGDFQDTLYVDALSYSPVRLIRVGIHAGLKQELLTETFVELALNGLRFPAETFTWTSEDERGIVRDSVLKGGPPK